MSTANGGGNIPAFVGVDPGLSGAIALYVPHIPFSGQSLVEVFDMPIHEIAGKRSINHWSLHAMLTKWALDWEVKQVIIERVHSMPKQGVASSFNFGFSAGAANQAVASACLPLTHISPQTWKAMYGLRGGPENKDMSRQKASQLLPQFSNLWARKKDDGRAEAVLLAHYGSRLQ